ncbi:MAG: biotin transporter BioY [Chloroflexota bacterium]
MFRTLPQTRQFSLAQRLVVIGLFTLLTAIAAQFKFYLDNPHVPYTLQVLVVLLAGMVLGARDGALSQIFYIGLLVLNVPVAAGGVGVSALTGATAGYIVGFIPAAWVTGFMVEHGANRTWQRLAASLVGVAIIYACGLPVLKLTLGVDWATAWALSVAPFIVIDVVKAIVAAGLTEGGRAALLRYFLPPAGR